MERGKRLSWKVWLELVVLRESNRGDGQVGRDWKGC